MKEGRIQIGIVGAGNVLEAYVPECRKLSDRGLAEVAMICGRESQREKARALGIERFETSELSVLQNEAVDLVLILASMPVHARLVKAALEAGKHVVVEKPLATALEEGVELVELARKRKRQLVCAPFTILSPTFQLIAGRIESGVIGKPCLARGRYGWAGPWWSEWFYKKGGGCIFDLGVYPITSLTGLLGPARKVSAMTAVLVPEREIAGKRVKVEAEDTAQITIEFADGALGTVMSGFTMQQYRSPGIEIYGTTGAIQMMGDDWGPKGYELWQNEAGCWQVFKETQPDWPWADGLRHAVECLHLGKEPVAMPEHALHVLEIMLKAQESARVGRALELKTTFERPVFGSARPGEPAHLMHDRSRQHVTSEGGG